MDEARHLTMQELVARENEVRQSPADGGVVELIVRRPRVEAREVLQEGELNPWEGLAGDTWITRRSSTTPDGSSNPDMQIAIMNARVISLLAGERSRWGLAGDQLFVDLDLSKENLPPGTRLAIGDAIIETTDKVHSGCKKFAARFGLDALEFISAPERKGMRLRGIYARVVRPGVIREGDTVQRLDRDGVSA